MKFQARNRISNSDVMGIGFLVLGGYGWVPRTRDSFGYGWVPKTQNPLGTQVLGNFIERNMPQNIKIFDYILKKLNRYDT